MKRSTICLLVAILAMGAFFRLYNSYDNFRFLSDEARDMEAFETIWKGIKQLDLQKLPLEGPEAGSFEGERQFRAHHGAFYFYLMTPSAILSNFHPYGPALFTILLNIASVYLIFLLGKQLFDEHVGFISAALLAVSNFAVLYSRWAWNPNLVIFFLLLSLTGFLKVAQGKVNSWPLFGFSAIALTQIYILGYVFVLLVFLPLVFLVVTPFPKGKMLSLTIALMFTPLVPEIFFEFSSGFALTRTAMLFIQNSFASSGVPFLDTSGSLLLISLKNLLGFGDSHYALWGISFFLISASLACAIIGFKSIEMARNGLSSFLSLSYFRLRLHVFCSTTLRLKISLFVLWLLAILVIVFFFYARYGNVITDRQVLLFALPLGILAYAFLLRLAFLRTPLIPFGLALLCLFFYANVTNIFLHILQPYGVSFVHEKHLVEYLAHASAGQAYEIETNRGAEIDALVWLFKRSAFPPERVIESRQITSLGDASAHALYSIVIGNQQRTPRCLAGTLMQSFGELHLYQCA